MSTSISEFRTLEGGLYAASDADTTDVDDGQSGFGDGSNDWIGGATDFASDPGQAIEDPYGTVAGAADAATLNFDEGVGGLVSLVDDEEGNTAGPGQSEMWTPTPDDVNRTTDDIADAADAATPAWVDWVLDNQEVVVVLLVVLAALAATNGTIGTVGSSGG